MKANNNSSDFATIVLIELQGFNHQMTKFLNNLEPLPVNVADLVWENWSYLLLI